MTIALPRLTSLSIYYVVTYFLYLKAWNCWVAWEYLNLPLCPAITRIRTARCTADARPPHNIYPGSLPRLPSLAYRLSKKKSHLDLANMMVQRNPTDFSRRL